MCMFNKVVLGQKKQKKKKKVIDISTTCWQIPSKFIAALS